MAAAAGEPVTAEHVHDAARKRPLLYDKGGDHHYDVASAFIKSMRGSDADAAIYYLAVMIAGGEDPKFIARRIIIFASEDIGNADPQALPVAIAAARAVEFVGLPECRINLSQAVAYMARAPKSNASYRAIDRALADVRERGTLRPPKPLRDASYPGRRSSATARVTSIRTISRTAGRSSSTCPTSCWAPCTTSRARESVSGSLNSASS